MENEVETGLLQFHPEVNDSEFGKECLKILLRYAVSIEMKNSKLKHEYKSSLIYSTPCQNPI